MKTGSLPHTPINVPPPRSAKPALPNPVRENVKAYAGAVKPVLGLIRDPRD